MTADVVIERYCRQVVGGELPAGKYHVLACQRHLDDMQRSLGDWPYRFEPRLADWFFEFAQTMKHYKGRQWAGQNLVLTDCQKFRLGSLFGWVHKQTGLRRFRTSYNELPRKQGKSLEAATVVTYGAFFDGEPGAEAYCAATKRDQAKIVFGDAKQLAKQNSGLRQMLTIHNLNLSRADTNSKLEPLSADYDGMDGLNPHIYVVDEFHAIKDRGLIDVLETATGARDQPIAFQITTAGDDEISPCGDQHHYACQVLERVFEDETFHAFIAHAEKTDDPFAESTWRKANPHYDICVRPDDLRALATKARNMPSALAAFQQKRLNIWVNASSPWLNIEQWKAGQSSQPRAMWETQLEGDPCYLALDLSSKTDMSALVAVFPPTETRAWALLPWLFVPEDRVADLEKLYRVPLGQWVKDGFVQVTPGNRIDQRVIFQTVQDVYERFSPVRMGFDPWNIGNMDVDLLPLFGDDETRVIEVPQNMSQMSEPTKEFEAEVSEARMDANGDPVLLWMARNARTQVDTNENIRPTKDPKKMRGRIDGIVAAIIGMKVARADLDDGDDPVFYELDGGGTHATGGA